MIKMKGSLCALSNNAWFSYETIHAKWDVVYKKQLSKQVNTTENIVYRSDFHVYMNGSTLTIYKVCSENLSTWQHFTLFMPFSHLRTIITLKFTIHMRKLLRKNLPPSHTILIIWMRNREKKMFLLFHLWVRKSRNNLFAVFLNM